MHRIRRHAAILTLAIAIDLAFTADADAYLDPGTGSFLFQTVIAVVLGAAFTLKTYWQRVKMFFSGKQPAAVPSTSSKPEEDESGAA
jgi:hypothetical protein